MSQEVLNASQKSKLLLVADVKPSTFEGGHYMEEN